MKFNISTLSVALVTSIFLGLTVGSVPIPAQDVAAKTYIGSEACAECHDGEYETFSQHARKAKSFHSVEIMKKGLTPEEAERYLQALEEGRPERELPEGFTIQGLANSHGVHYMTAYRYVRLGVLDASKSGGTMQ